MNSSIEDEYQSALQRAQQLGIQIVGSGLTTEGQPLWVTTSSDGVSHHVVVQTAERMRCDCELAQYKPQSLCTHAALAHQAALAECRTPAQPAPQRQEPEQPAERPPHVVQYDGRKKKCSRCGRGFTVGQDIVVQGWKAWHPQCGGASQPQARHEAAPIAYSNFSLHR
jgi:hypothetical protein